MKENAWELAILVFLAHGSGWIAHILYQWRQGPPKPLQPDDCIFGRCGCETALHCKFPRCSNCDNIVDSKGSTLDSRWAEDLQRCPICGGRIPT